MTMPRVSIACVIMLLALALLALPPARPTVIAAAQPSAQSATRRVGSPGSPVQAVAVDGGVASIVTATRRLQIVDAAIPSRPTRSATIRMPESLVSIAVAGNIVYGGDEDGQLWVIDAREALAPTVLSRIDTGGTIGQVQVVGDLVYVTHHSRATGLEGFQIIDVRDPAQPLLRGSTYLPGTIVDLQVQNSRVYTISTIRRADGSAASTLVIIDVSNPDCPTLDGSFTTTRIDTLQVQGTQAYLSQPNSLQILDVSDPAAIIQLGSYPYPAPVYSAIVQVVQQRAYVAYYPSSPGDGQLEMVDLSDPVHPIMLGRYRIMGDGGASRVHDLRIAGDTLYLTYAIHLGPGADSGSLEIVDVRDPAHPARRGLHTASGLANAQVVGRLAYVTIVESFNRSWLETVDLSDPAHPIVRERTMLPGSFPRLLVMGDRAYATGIHGLQILPLHPERVPATVTLSPAGGILVAHDENLRLAVPPDAVTSTVTLTYTGLAEPSQPLDLRRSQVRSFTLDARTGAGAARTRLALPATLTIHYTDDLVTSRQISNEASLNLSRWNGSAWQDLLPCAECSFDPAKNRMTVQVQQFGEYTLVGDWRARFLPLVLR